MTQPTQSPAKLIFVRINAISHKWMPSKKETWVKYDYEHTMNRFVPDSHYYSPDKDAHRNAYAVLEQDKHYIIQSRIAPGIGDVVNGKQMNRWIWAVAYELSEKHIRLAYKFYIAHADDLPAVAKYIDSLVNPKVTDVFGDEFTS